MSEDRHQLDRIEVLLHKVLSRLSWVEYFERIIMKELDDLQTEVTANTDAGSSMSLLITKLVGLYEAAKADPAKISAITAQVRSNTDAWAAAVLANTPAAPPVS